MPESEKEKLELKKLQIEVKSLESKSNWKNNLTSKLIPLFLTFSGLVLSYISFYLPFKLQSKQQEHTTFMNLINQATTSPTAEGRIAGIWMLNSYWDEKDRNKQILIANALSGIIMSDEESIVRMTAAEVIGNAYIENDSKSKNDIKIIREKLYGNVKTGEFGSITYANWWLTARCGEATNQLNSIYPDITKLDQIDQKMVSETAKV